VLPGMRSGAARNEERCWEERGAVLGGMRSGAGRNEERGSSTATSPIALSSS
jgi:hypothetical protein